MKRYFRFAIFNVSASKRRASIFIKDVPLLDQYDHDNEQIKHWWIEERKKTNLIRLLYNKTHIHEISLYRRQYLIIQNQLKGEREREILKQQKIIIIYKLKRWNKGIRSKVTK